MPVSRFLFFSTKHYSRQARNLLQRFGPSKRLQSCNYAKSTGNKNGRLSSHPVIATKTQASGSTETQASRSWSTYIVPIGILGVVGTAATIFHYNDERRAIPKGQGGSSQGSTSQGPVIGGPFTLIDTEGQVVTEKNLRGNWVLLYFGYTSSPDVGPEQVQLVAKVVDILESKQKLKIVPVFVTLDPQRDNTTHLRAYLKEFDSRIIGLTGTATAIRQMAQEYRIYFKKVQEEGGDYLVESSHNMYLMNPNMDIVRCFGVEYNAEELSEAIVNEMKREAKHNGSIASVCSTSPSV